MSTAEQPRRRGRPRLGTPPLNRSEIVLESMRQEALAVVWLRQYLEGVQRTTYMDKVDATYQDKRIEIKCSRFDGALWRFNIHRHGVLNEEGVNVYLLRLLDLPGTKAAIHLIIPAPLKTSTVTITLRSLLTRYAQYYNRIDLIDPSKTKPTDDELEGF